jgi:hypothetical protein
MRSYRFLIIYRRENDPEAGVWKATLVATSKKEAISKFYSTVTNGSFNRISFRVIEVIRLVEPVRYRPAHNYWKPEEPRRPKCQKYVCPFCSERCYATSYGCNYRFCPNCGREVIVYETVDRP